MQPVCGFVVDLIGLRLGFALFAMLWSIVGVAHGFASGWLSLGILRGFLGLFEAAAIPSGMKAVAEWFPDREKSVAVGYFNAGTSLGAAIAPPLVVFLSMRFGWQAAFMATGALGFVWAALWYAQYRSPADHPRITPQERALIRDGQATMPPVSKRRIRDVVTARRFWAIALPRFFAEPAWQTFSFWIPLYLATERHMELKQIAIFAWMPFLAADLGGIAGGYLSPYLAKRFKLPLVWSRVAGVALGAVLMLGPAMIGRRVAVHGHRAVLRRRLRAPDDLRTRQHAVGRRVRSRGSRHRERLRRNGRVDRRPRLRCWSARSPTRSAMRRCSRASACSTSSASRCSRC